MICMYSYDLEDTVPGKGTCGEGVKRQYKEDCDLGMWKVIRGV